MSVIFYIFNFLTAFWAALSAEINLTYFYLKYSLKIKFHWAKTQTTVNKKIKNKSAINHSIKFIESVILISSYTTLLIYWYNSFWKRALRSIILIYKTKMIKTVSWCGHFRVCFLIKSVFLKKWRILLEDLYFKKRFTLNHSFGKGINIKAFEH